MFLGARTCFLSLSAVAGLAFIACSSPSDRPTLGSEPPDASIESSGESGTGTFGTGDPDASPSQKGCAEEAKLVYVLSLEGDLYSFAPAAKKFTKVGPLNCKSGSKILTPISMAVDRKAVAWVNMRDETGDIDDTIFKVDTSTAACTPTAIKGNMGGMGFSTNDGTTDEETLYVIGDGSTGFNAALVKVDFAKQKLMPVADLKEDVDLELTGTGDGRLYGFLIDSPLALAAVDKSTAAFSDRVSLSKVETPEAPMFAFSFWGGDFYFYTATDTASTKTTNVTRYRPSDKSVDTSYMKSIGFHIVGAGVSTCAPTVAPK